MPSKDDHPEETDRERRIEELKRRAEALAGGDMTCGEIQKPSPEVEEKFWESVVAHEEAPWTTNRKQLEKAGVSLPAPETLEETELSLKLWEVIDRLAAMRVFFSATDHLSDRELYTLILTDILEEEVKDLALDEDSACHIDLLGSGSEADTFLYLKYYADEDFRRAWRSDYPDDPLPDLEDPPYDRDRFLPAPDYGPPCDLTEDKD